MVEIAAPVMINSHATSASSPKDDRPTGRVYISTELVTINGQMKAVQLPRKTKIAKAASAGLTKGIATVVVPNCWGDLWHNRSGVADNYYRCDGFVREGRTLAEFAYLHTVRAFPPGNPVAMPVKAQPDRVFMIGLGEGSRAVAELLKLEDGGTPSYPVAGLVVDSPEDDLSGYYAPSGDASLNAVKTGLDRIHLGGVEDLEAGTLSTLTTAQLPPRVGVLAPSGDSAILPSANDLLLERLGELSASDAVEVWQWTPPVPAHVLSNADPAVAKAVADFLGDGLDAVDGDLRDDG